MRAFSRHFYGALVFALASFYVSSCGQGVCSINGCGAASAVDDSVVITLTGSGFKTGATVVVNGTNCTNVNVLSSTTLSCTLPSSKIIIVHVIITNSDGSTPTVNPGVSFVKTVTTVGGGTFTIPSGVTALQIELLGGGGGGADADVGNPGDHSGGGGGGAYSKAQKTVTAGQVISYSVGGGGLGSTSGLHSGANGVQSTCSTFSMVAGGGTGSTYGGSGAGGVATGGDSNVSGGNADSGTPQRGGDGAPPLGGVGGTDSEQLGCVPTAQSGKGPGAGGGGGCAANGAVLAAGGDGANGKVVFTYSVQ